MTRSWISDTPDEVEHPPIPLCLNKMAIPRAALVLSVVTGLGLLFSSIWVGLSAMSFLDDLEASFGTTDVEMLNDDGRWLWEVSLLFDTCSSREDDWEWPDSLASQDDLFLLPGEVRCDWQHQGDGDSASIVVHNRGNQTLNLVMEISGGAVVFAANSEPYLIINELSANQSTIMEINLIESVSEREISVTATHISVLQAQVRMDVNIFQGPESKDLHVHDGDWDTAQVQYTVWDADTGEKIDEGFWADNSGDPWFSIEGFGWSLVGLDIDIDRGVLSRGTSHITLLPPPIAYGNSEGHELEETWLRFEVELERCTCPV